MSPPVQRHRAIVTPQWLLDSLEERTFLNYQNYLALRKQQREEDSANGDDPQSVDSSPGPQSRGTLSDPLSPHSVAQITGDKDSYRRPYACMRLCPLVCANQDLADHLGILKLSRELEGQDVNALAYERAISVGITSTPIPKLTRSLGPQVIKGQILSRKTCRLRLNH